LEAGGSAPVVLNAANEVAVEGFLKERIGFLDIAHVVERCLEAIEHTAIGSIDDVLAVDAEGRRRATEFAALI